MLRERSDRTVKKNSDNASLYVVATENIVVFVFAFRLKYKLNCSCYNMIPGYNSITQAFLGTLFTWALTAVGSGLVFVFRSGQVTNI